MRASLSAWCVSLTLASSAVLCGVTFRTPQTVYGDQAYQLKALQQYLHGESSSINRLMTADPKDLSKNVGEWFSWWPPGPQLLVYPFVRAGIPFGQAVRWWTIFLITAGALGWVRWFALFTLPGWMRRAWAVLVPWMHYASNNVFAFSSEAIAFAATPWILLGAEAVARRGGLRSDRSLVLAGLALGLGMGLGYDLKYSIVFTGISALIYLWPRLRPAVFSAVAVSMALPIAALNAINYLASRDMNPVATTAGLHLKPLALPWIVALASLALTDGYSLLNFIFLHPTHGLFRHEGLICFLGLPGGLLLLFLLYRRRTSEGSARLAILTLGFAMAAMVALWNLTEVGNYDGRYLAVFSLSVLPLALEEGIALFRKGGAVWKAVLASAGLCYVALPLLYGAVSVSAKVARLPSDYRRGPSGFLNLLLAEHDLAGVRSELLRDYDPATDLWYAPDPTTALDLPGRLILCFADYIPAEELARTRYASTKPYRIRLLLPPRLDENGKGEIIRRSFVQSGAWTRRQIADGSMVLWETRLTPK